MMMIKHADDLTNITTEEIEVGMIETGEIDVHGEEMEEDRLVKPLLIFPIPLRPERRTSIDMSRKPIDVSVDVHGMMFATLTVTDMIVLLVRVIGLRLMNELGEIDTPLIIFDLLPVLRLRLLKLTLGSINLIHPIHLILNLCLV